MLIDATHAEETRVVVLDGSRLEDFDVETATKKQLKGNIYLAKVVRVEPSLQAAFVEYGGNRHGFLAFDEIHPDYYQIPVADRQRLIDMQAEDARREEEAEDRAAESETHAAGPSGDTAIDVVWHIPPVEEAPTEAAPAIESGDAQPPEFDTATEAAGDHPAQAADIAGERITASADGETQGEPAPRMADSTDEAVAARPLDTETEMHAGEVVGATDQEVSDTGTDTWSTGDQIPEQPPPETMGGEDSGGDDARDRRIQSRFLRSYKIQEVIRRRQILLVQVVKEERGTKGAALTTYISLAGRFCVLMPNSPRGGGISRKITSVADRRRLKDIIAELDIAQGMGLIVRTAGANRPKPEIRRDCEYLLRLWDDIREHTMKSVAPALIYEEASLIKRAIRDVYSRDIDEIQVDGEDGWRAAHEFMRMLMPSHAKKVQLWRDSTPSNGGASNGGLANGGGQPLFAKYSVEAQLDAMLQPIVQLRSGGYLVINQTEALVAIDVNSGRSTRERGIEETALRTNMEAADETARQLRLRDLAGLIVIDFIDMEAKKHNGMVERRLKEALKNDRARIQVGHISHFGLMEMSRQRLRPSLAETSFIACPHCGGTGHVRSTESAAIHVLRGVEEEGAKRRAAEIVAYMSVPVALYILNHKRERLAEIEARYAMQVVCLGDEGQMASQYRIDRVKPQVASDVTAVITQDMHPPAMLAPPTEVEETEPEEPDVILVEPVAVEVVAEAVEEIGGAARAEVGETAEEAERRHRRRRRRRRGGQRDDAGAVVAEPVAADETAGSEVGDAEAVAAETHIEGVPEHAEAAAEDEPRGRRRGRRGGRRRRPDGADGEMPSHAEPGAEQPDLPPVYSGPTPANPFGGHAFDIFDVLDRVEATVAVPSRATAREVRAELEPEFAPVAMAEPVAEAAETSSAEPVAEPLPEPVPELVSVGNREPVPEPAESSSMEPVAEPLPEPVPELVTAGDGESEPAIKPIVIGDGAAPIVERKRGWWRR
jgi:ribonuclease E